jgi:hypothetical protein
MKDDTKIKRYQRLSLSRRQLLQVGAVGFGSLLLPGAFAAFGANADNAATLTRQTVPLLLLTRWSLSERPTKSVRSRSCQSGLRLGSRLTMPSGGNSPPRCTHLQAFNNRGCRTHELR